MPVVIHPRTRGRVRLLVAPAALLAVACGAMTGSAQAAPTTTTTTTTTTTSCPVQPTSQVFAAFGDTAEYSLAPGGSFESGTAPWALNSNTLVSENDPFYLNGTSDVRSVSIRPSSSVVSPPICVDVSNPFLRLVAKKAVKGNLKVELLYTDPSDGSPSVKRAGSLVMGGTEQNGNYSAWAPSPKLDLATALPLDRSSTGTLSVRIRLSADSNAGDWRVDDVFIDPYRAG